MKTIPESALNGSDVADNASNGSEPTFVGATAWAGSELVNFRQAGRGKPVLLLGAGAESGVEIQLASELASRFRVVLPSIATPSGNGKTAESGRSATSLGETIELFLDTLGFSRVSLIATPPFASAALAYALMDTERIERLVIFIDDRLRNGAPIPLTDRLSDSGIPLIAMSWPDTQPDGVRESCVSTMIQEVATFLGDS